MSFKRYSQILCDFYLAFLDKFYLFSGYFGEFFKFLTTYLYREYDTKYVIVIMMNTHWLRYLLVVDNDKGLIDITLKLIL